MQKIRHLQSRSRGALAEGPSQLEWPSLGKFWWNGSAGVPPSSALACRSCYSLQISGKEKEGMLNITMPPLAVWPMQLFKCKIPWKETKTLQKPGGGRWHVLVRWKDYGTEQKMPWFLSSYCLLKDSLGMWWWVGGWRRGGSMKRSQWQLSAPSNVPQLVREQQNKWRRRGESGCQTRKHKEEIQDWWRWINRCDHMTRSGAT